jgi:hypothetical protein
MKFLNPTSLAVGVELGSDVVMVEPGGDIDIPDDLSWIVERRGLPLCEAKGELPKKQRKKSKTESEADPVADMMSALEPES